MFSKTQRTITAILDSDHAQQMFLRVSILFVIISTIDLVLSTTAIQMYITIAFVEFFVSIATTFGVLQWKRHRHINLSLKNIALVVVPLLLALSFAYMMRHQTPTTIEAGLGTTAFALMVLYMYISFQRRHGIQ